MAAQYSVDGEHTEHVATLALGMFDELAALGLHDGDARERELLWAACMLHDVGMSIDYDDHHKHSRYLILNGGLPGFTPVETAIIAQAARYHRKGMPAPGPMSALFGEGDSRAWIAARRCCASPRTSSARATSWCAPRDLELHDGEVELQADRRRRVRGAALGRRPRARAVREGVPQGPLCGGVTSAGCWRRCDAQPAAASAAASPAQSNSTSP